MNASLKITNMEDNCKKFEALYGSTVVGSAKVSESPTGFLAEDFKASHPDAKIVEIYDIYVTPAYRNMNIGSDLIGNIVKYYGGPNTDTVILTAAGASMKEYKEEPTDEAKIEIAESLRPFYEQNNFIDVNNYYAGYEFKNAYMYENDTSRKYLEERKKQVEEFNKKE